VTAGAQNWISQGLTNDAVSARGPFPLSLFWNGEHRDCGRPCAILVRIRFSLSPGDFLFEQKRGLFPLFLNVPPPYLCPRGICFS